MSLQNFICSVFCIKPPQPTTKPQKLSLAWGRRVDAAFREKVLEITGELGWTEDHADWLMACMAFETGRTFSPSVKNPHSSATGLIQFMAATARGLGTSTAALARMTAVEQLDWVKRYFEPTAQRIRSLEDMYMAILWPKGIGQPLEYVLWKTNTRSYAVNKGLDLDRDGDVEKQEAAKKVQQMLSEGRTENNLWSAL